MPDAVKQPEGGLGSPTVGTWRATLCVGAVVQPGDLFGRILKFGRWVHVKVPPGVSGVLRTLTPSGQWVAHADALATWGSSAALEIGSAGEQTDAATSEEGMAIRAETDGTIYLSPEPSKPAYVAVGDVVSARQTLGLVEVMKTFTPVRAPKAGRVLTIEVSDGEPVSEGDVLFRMSPDVSP